MMTRLKPTFFDRDACLVARQLLGKVIRRQYRNQWLSARIIETEAYYLEEKGSHASLGFTPKRQALFMPAGTIYMYYARGRDSLNISCKGQGNAVLIKSAYPVQDSFSDAQSITTMQILNPQNNGQLRPVDKLCQGQTLLCQSLDLKVPDWDQMQFDEQVFYFEDVGYQPEQIIQTSRLGIPEGRDEHLAYRFIDLAFSRHCSRNPLTRRGWREGREYTVLETN